MRRAVTGLGAMFLMLAGSVATPPPAAAADAAPTAYDKLTPKPLAQRVAVSIYEFRSQLSQLSESGVTDMFMTALVKSGQFRVVERNRLNQGVAEERRLNAAGQTTGTSAQHQLRGAQYLFEGAVSEANAGVSSQQGGINIGGLQLGGGRSHDTISVDVRILDADTGDVLDSVTVTQPVKATSMGISGTAALASTIAAAHGGSSSAFTPDVSAQTSAQSGVDATVRSCIEAAVVELAKRVDLPAGN